MSKTFLNFPLLFVFWRRKSRAKMSGENSYHFTFSHSKFASSEDKKSRKIKIHFILSPVQFPKIPLFPIFWRTVNYYLQYAFRELVFYKNLNSIFIFRVCGIFKYVFRMLVFCFKYDKRLVIFENFSEIKSRKCKIEIFRRRKIRFFANS